MAKIRAIFRRLYLRYINVGLAWIVLEQLRREVDEEKYSMYLSLSVEEAAFMLAHQGTPYEHNIVRSSVSAELQAWPRRQKSTKQIG